MSPAEFSHLELTAFYTGLAATGFTAGVWIKALKATMYNATSG